MSDPHTFNEPWQAEIGDFEIYPKSGGDAIAYAESAQVRDRIITCVNSLSGIADPATTIQRMRDVIKASDKALCLCLNHILSLPSSAPGELEAVEAAHQTLSKIQPLLKI